MFLNAVLWLILVLRGVRSRNQPGATLTPLGGIFKGKNKMPARYFKVKYDFSTNEAMNRCIHFHGDFDGAIHFLYYLNDLRSSLRSKSQFQGQVSKINIFNK